MFELHISKEACIRSVVEYDVNPLPAFVDFLLFDGFPQLREEHSFQCAHDIVVEFEGVIVARRD